MPDKPRAVRGRPRARGRPLPGQYPISNGVAELAMDLDAEGGWLLTIEGVPSSYVDVTDPTYLDFEYVRWIGHLVDRMRDPDAPITAAHLGGAGCTIPRYVEATRRGSTQVIFDYDPLLLQLVRDAFGLRSGPRFRMRAADARAGLSDLAEGSQDLVVRDAFAGPVVPDHLQTVEFLRIVGHVLRADGIYVANLADRPPLRSARAEVATTLAAFRHVAAISEPQVFRGRREGNLVILASERPLPQVELVRVLATEPIRARLMNGDELARFTAGAAILTDEQVDRGGAPADEGEHPAPDGPPAESPTADHGPAGPVGSTPDPAGTTPRSVPDPSRTSLNPQ